MTAAEAAELDPAPPPTLTRPQIAELTAQRLQEEWEAAGLPALPFTATVLGEVYATSYGLEVMLAGFDELGGMAGFGKVLGGVFGRRGRKGRRGQEEEPDSE